jgi:hypothetical protein
MIEICDIDTPSSIYTVELDITERDCVKKYLFAVNRTIDTGGNFQRLLPFSANSPNDIHVEMSLVGLAASDARFRLVRTSVGVVTSVDCHFKICHDTSNPVNFIELAGTGNVIATFATAAIYSSTALTQVGGRVGINTSTPLFPLDVVGAANVSGNVTAGNVSAAFLTGVLNTGAQPGITSVGTLSALTVSGGQITGTLASGAQTGITSVGTLGSLNVTAGVTAATLTGQLATGAQPNITSVGTLSSLTASALTVSGNLTIDTNTLTVNSVSNRVGIVTANPAHPLDVTGDINTSGALRIAGNPVLSATALGSGVTTSQLTSVGTLSSLAVSGTTTLMDTCDIFSLAKSLPPIGGNVMLSGVGDTMSLYTLNQNFGGTCVLKLDITQNEGANNCISKSYTIPVGWNTTQNQWRRVLPDKSDQVVNDIGLEISVFGNVTSNTTSTNLRLVRTNIHLLSNLVNANIHVNSCIHYSKSRPVVISGETLNTPSFSQLNAYESGANVYTGTALTQISTRDTLGNPTGVVGIFKELPDKNFSLDVSGRINSGSIVSTGNINTTGMCTVGVGFNFANVWRFAYNPSTQNVEIQKNTTPGDSNWANFTTTGILAAL